MTRSSATFVLSLLAAMALVSAACGASGAGADPQLPGTSWTVTSVAGQPADATVPPTMAFGADGTVSGTGGCNSYSGSYKLDGASIEVSPLASTLILCDGPVGTQETAFFAALQGATSWAIDGNDELTLEGAGAILATSSLASS